MLPSVHFFASLVGIGILFPFYGLWSFTFFIGSFLVDADHYIWYVIKTGDLNLTKAYLYCRDERNRGKDALHIFHVWEFWVLMFFLAFFNNFFGLIFLGLAFHLIIDFIDLILHIDDIHNRAFSFFMWLNRH